MKVMVVYSSRTGNTKKVAEAAKHPDVEDLSRAQELFRGFIAGRET